MTPTAFKLGELAVHWYGLMMALGFLGAYFVCSRHAKRTGFPPEYVADSVIAAVIGGLIGARINFLISYWGDYIENCAKNDSNPWIHLVFVHEGGLVFLGGFFGAAIAVALLAKLRKVSVMQMADMAALGVPIGHVFGRIGCFMTGCCFGKPTEGPIQVTYPAHFYGSLKKVHLDHGLIEKGAEHCHPILPSQLFASFSNLLIFVIIYLMMRSRRLKKSGQLFGLYLILYPVSRFINAFFRGEHDDKHLYWRWLWEDGLSEAQTRAPFMIIGGLLWFFLAKQFAPEIPEFLPVNNTPKASNEQSNDDSEHNR